VVTLRSITPLIPAGDDLDRGVRFFTEELGFVLTWQGGTMAGVRRDHVELNLVQNSNPVWAANSSASIGVADLAALYAEYRTTSAQVGSLELKSWGRREFHMILPSGVCLQFYEADE
jgi:hypothetical protein